MSFVSCDSVVKDIFAVAGCLNSSLPVFHEILTHESLSRQHSRARYIAFAQFSMSRCLQRHCLLIAHIAQQAKPWLCLGHPAGGRLLQGGAQCSKETLERAVQKCECPCEPANELVRTTRLSTHNAQRSSQCLLPPPLRALLQLSRLQATTHPARSILSPPLSDPFLIPVPPPRSSSCVVLPHTLHLHS